MSRKLSVIALFRLPIHVCVNHCTELMCLYFFFIVMCTAKVSIIMHIELKLLFEMFVSIFSFMN